MTSIGALSLWIPIWRSTLIYLDLPLASLIGIIGMRKKNITCTQETTRVKLEQLHSSRLVLHDQ
jgi:hypothetical protein